jgi:PEP-CTERM motif
MKTRFVVLLLSALWLTTLPAVSQTDIYDNGPTNGTVDAWTINYGFIMSDSFIVPTGGANISGLSFSAWLFTGDTLQSVNIGISEYEMGHELFDQQVNLTQSGCVLNQYGYNVCTETGSFTPFHLNAGAYWINLSNGVDTAGDPVYWDENSGPSTASSTSTGTDPSESFTVLGSTNSGTGTTPEPSSLMLFATGVLGLGDVLRRKFLR